MERYLEYSSRNKENPFNELLGKWITHKSDIISIGGLVTYPKGQRNYISDVEYRVGMYGKRSGNWLEPSINTIYINGIGATTWSPSAFEEFEKVNDEWVFTASKATPKELNTSNK